MKIVSLCPSNTELIYYAGAGEQLVGIDDFSDFPYEITSQLPRLGPDLDIRMDDVEKLQPDLVFASHSVPGMEKNTAEMDRRGIPYVLVTNPVSLRGIGEALEETAGALGRKAEGKQKRQAFDHFLDSYQTMAQAVPHRPRVYWEWWPKPVFTPGRTNWLTELTDLAGGKNLFGDYPEASVQTTWDEVLARDPDRIFAAWVGVRRQKVNPEVLLKRQGWRDMRAVREDHLYILDEPLYCRPSPRLMAGLAEAAHLLHPDIFPVPDGEEDLRTLGIKGRGLS
ncbi:cobalamin-binding protein [Alkalicoccus chagannorensis]|uniref:cobalamin-binding protein n=1 Tax=Alkalicoccus chagannorensis TaxID=427072 RepID=UPI0003F73BB8|nr:cobalamin-binding protein [Alkalicoccus chagannorensis]